jgi:D-lactate dehydrogenase (cytochrome)
MGFLVNEAGAGAIDMMRTLKRALDPKNIMNPGKIFVL